MAIVENALRGAMAGLGLGLAEYVIVLRMIGGAVAREAGQGGELAGLGLMQHRLRSIKLALMASAFLVLPALGFFLGSTLGPEMGSVR